MKSLVVPVVVGGVGVRPWWSADGTREWMRRDGISARVIPEMLNYSCIGIDCNMLLTYYTICIYAYTS